jgi:ribosomal protein L37AE/L43A
MRITDNIYATTRCPKCKLPGYIAITDAGGYWLTRTIWTCGHCGRANYTADLQAEQDRRRKRD